MSNELKPCPFCRGEAEYRCAKYARTPFKHSVVCLDCFASIPPKDSKHEAINAWNTRAERTCKWSYEDYHDESNNIWSTECGERYSWEPYGHPKNCPGCGAKVVE